MTTIFPSLAATLSMGWNSCNIHETNIRETTDALGSVRQLVDENGTLTLTQAYQPYGESLTSDGSGTSSYGFTSEWTDATGLQYLRAIPAGTLLRAGAGTVYQQGCLGGGYDAAYVI